MRVFRCPELLAAAFVVHPGKCCGPVEHVEFEGRAGIESVFGDIRQLIAYRRRSFLVFGNLAVSLAVGRIDVNIIGNPPDSLYLKPIQFPFIDVFKYLYERQAVKGKILGVVDRGIEIGQVQPERPVVHFCAQFPGGIFFLLDKLLGRRAEHPDTGIIELASPVTDTPATVEIDLVRHLVAQGNLGLKFAVGLLTDLG